MFHIFLRRQQVEDRTALKRSTLYQRIKEGVFPAPVNTGTRSVAWIEREVEAVNAARARGATADELRQLVSELHQARGYRPSEAKEAKYKQIVQKRRQKAAHGAQAA